ncbi:MAG: LCP family protein [Heliobacteriaceae bacterium]|jgi:LCP family protein required for cell wall assembly|nr:LCP family protein [Heliobacteriaceae bacterium]
MINNDNDEINPYLRTAKQNIEEQSSFLQVLTIMMVVFLGVLLGMFILADNRKFLENRFGKDSFITNIFIKLARSNDKKEKADFSFPFGLKRQNILFLGVDAGENDPFTGTRSDTIIILNIDPKSKSVNAISVPRDSKVYLPHDKGVNKINSAHAIGGIKMAKETIEDTLGIRIDKYIVVHDEAVRQIVDALGGLDLYVEKPMRYNDYAGKLHINLSKGEHHLNGSEAVGYLRFRHDALGDIGRTQRQQWFLRAMVKQLKDQKALAEIPDIISIAKKYIKTDMSLYELSQYAAIIKYIDTEKTEIATLPGAPNQKGYVSYWILDPEKTQEVINRLIYRDKAAFDENIKMIANVMYSPENEPRAKSLIENMKALNIEIKCTGSAGRTHSQFVAHTDRVTGEYYGWLKKKTAGFDGIQFVYDPLNYYCSGTDFTVVLAGQ